jgi:lysophospholipase L1-like esterase
MKKLKKTGVVLFLLVTSGLFAQTEQPPYWKEIQAFKKQDSLNPPAKDKVLFVGSSSFTMWKDVQNYFSGYKIINRGFGGSSLPDVIRYVDDVIILYQPKQIVIYCGENDLAASDNVSPDLVLNRFKELFFLVRNQLPKVPIVFISIKPSPSRQHLMPKMEAANKLIKKFLKKERKTAFVDVYHKMLTADGKPMDDIFLEDKLHMNAKGYAIWQKAIEPYLKK